VTQRGTQMVQLPEEQASFGTGLGIVAIIDTGVDTGHPALRGSLVPGYDFTRNSADTVSELTDLDQSTVVILDQLASVPLETKVVPIALSQSTVVILDQSTVVILDNDMFPEDFGHGTMVAGLVHLIAPTAQIMPLKAFHADGSANLSDIVRAIRYAADNGASVISMSFDMPVLSAELQSAVTYAESKGAILVAAAGNEGKSESVYPAALSGVIGVGSVNFEDRRSPFSNYGRAARLSAPGEALITTFPGNNYAGVWGTSFSTALVSGAVTLMRQLQPRLHSSDLMDCLEAGAQIDQGMGDARLDLVRSLTACVHPDE
jgi:subtilisin family serine protease